MSNLLAESTDRYLEIKSANLSELTIGDAEDLRKSGYYVQIENGEAVQLTYEPNPFFRFFKS